MTRPLTLLRPSRSSSSEQAVLRGKASDCASALTLPCDLTRFLSLNSLCLQSWDNSSSYSLGSYILKAIDVKHIICSVAPVYYYHK